MRNSVTNRIVEAVTAVDGVSPSEAPAMVDTLVDSIRVALEGGRRVELRGLGVFQVKPKRRGVGRVVRHGAAVPIPEGPTVRFKPSEALRRPVVAATARRPRKGGKS